MRRERVAAVRTTSNDARSSETSAPRAFAARIAASASSGRYSVYPSTWRSLGERPSASSAGKSSARIDRDAPKYVRIVRCPPFSTMDKHRADPGGFPEADAPPSPSPSSPPAAAALSRRTGRTPCASRRRR